MDKATRLKVNTFPTLAHPPLYRVRGGFLKILPLLTLLSLAVHAITLGAPPPDGNNSAPEAIRTVVLDAGHGGKDPGTLGKNSKEKDVTLAVVLKLGHYIERAFPEVKVVYTRKTDEFIELNRRSEIANKAGADLFISVHCNSAPTPLARGAETFVMGLDVSDSNMAVAQRENAVISLEEDYSEKYEGYDPNSPESFIIFSLMQNIFLNQSLSLASIVQGEFTERVQRVNRGVKQERFLVLYKSGMPSILVELGFLTHPAEEQFLLSSEGQDLMASALFRAFRSYKEKVEQRATPTMIINPPEPVPTPSKREKEAPRGNQATKDKKGKKNSQAGPKSKGGFLIQVSCVKRPIEANHPLRKEFPDLIEEKSGGYYRYYAQAAQTMEEAQKALKQIRKKYPDAFIVKKS